MKDVGTILLGAGILYVLLREGNDATAAPAAGGFTETPFAGAPTNTPVPITAGDVMSARDIGLTNAEIVDVYTRAQTATIPQGKAYTVLSKKGKQRTIVGPPPGTNRTSINQNQYLASRPGGGYKVIGARNIKLNP